MVTRGWPGRLSGIVSKMGLCSSNVNLDPDDDDVSPSRGPRKRVEFDAAHPVHTPFPGECPTDTDSTDAKVDAAFTSAGGTPTASASGALRSVQQKRQQLLDGAGDSPEDLKSEGPPASKQPSTEEAVPVSTSPRRSIADAAAVSHPTVNSLLSNSQILQQPCVK